MRPWGPLVAMGGAILCVLALLLLGGCTYSGAPVVFHWRVAITMLAAVITVITIVLGVVWGMVRLETWFNEASDTAQNRFVLGVSIAVLAATFVIAGLFAS